MGRMTSDRPDRPNGQRHGQTPGRPYDPSYGHPYGRAPQGAGTTLSAVYRFVLVWLTMALILWFGTRLLGIDRGDVVVAVVSLVLSLAATVGLTAWLRRRGR